MSKKASVPISRNSLIAESLESGLPGSPSFWNSHITLLGDRQVGLVNGGPTYSATPISMIRRLTPRIVIKRACRNNDLLAAARLVRHGAIAALVDLPRKACGFRQIVAEISSSPDTQRN